MIGRRRRAAANAPTPPESPHPLDILVAMSSLAEDETVRRLVRDMSLDAAGGGAASGPEAVRIVSSILRQPTPTAHNAVSALLVGLDSVETDGFGTATAFGCYSAPILERLASTAGVVTATERMFLAVVIDSIDSALTQFGLETAVGVAALGCDLTLAVHAYATAISVELTAGPTSTELDAVRARVRQSTLRLIADGSPDDGAIQDLGVGGGLTQQETSAVVEQVINELSEQRAAVIRGVRGRLGRT